MTSHKTIDDQAQFFDSFMTIDGPEEISLTQRQKRKLQKREERRAHRAQRYQQNQPNLTPATQSISLRTITPLTDRQAKAFDGFRRGDNLVLYGYSGTGKSMVALYLALEQMHNQQSDIDKVIIFRSAVGSRNIGFLPGGPEAKLEIYEQPYKYLVNNKLYNGRNAYDTLKKQGKISFESTSFSRGMTYDNAVIILEEAQNYTWEEIYTLATRLGQSSRLIINGDFRQLDLRGPYDISGFDKMLSTFKKLSGITMVEFQSGDIVRSDFVRNLILATE